MHHGRLASMRGADLLRHLWRSHTLFGIALVAGAAVRLLVQLSFPPAFAFSDGPTYLDLADTLHPSQDRPIGYSIVLRALWVFGDRLDVVTVAQHLLGLATAVVAYAVLRRRGVGPVLATVATLPMLFDAMELVLEHSVLSDVLFDLLIIVVVAVLAWNPVPRLRATAAAGLLLGAATIVRLVGGPTVVVVAVFLLLALPTLRTRAVHVGVLVAAFVLPLAAYAGWYHLENGAWALTQSGGRAIYIRSTSFVDCTTLSLPSYERTLCPRAAPDERGDPTFYGYHSSYTVSQLAPPPGISNDEAMRDFGERAIANQPLDYLRIVARDFVAPFVRLDRSDFDEYSTADKWTFAYWVDYQTTEYTEPAYAAHGGEMPTTRHPTGDWLAAYGRAVYVPGPADLALGLLALLGLAVRRRGGPPLRALTFLCLALPLLLILVPDVTAQFTWRYQLPLTGLLPMAAAFGLTRLLGARSRDEEAAVAAGGSQEPELASVSSSSNAP